MTLPPIVECPICQRPVRFAKDNPYRPFCSERCRLIDLGAWASEDHRIPGEPDLDQTDLDQGLNVIDDDDCAPPRQ